MAVAGYRNGYFLDVDDRRRAIRDIVDSGADFAIVGMGAPLQEQFALDLRDAGFKGIVFTCGGFLHQTADRINYYPDWVNRYNLRAFYRLFHEKGLWGRLYNVLIEFPVLFTYDTIRSRWIVSSTSLMGAEEIFMGRVGLVGTPRPWARARNSSGHG